MAVKPASTWGTKWSAGVSAKSNEWAAGYIAAGDAVFKAGAAAGPSWQAAVNTAQALKNFQDALNSTTMSSVTATVNGAGKQKYRDSATNKNANYNAFATEFFPALNNAVNSLPARGPRRSGVNRQRMNSMLDFLESVAGQYKQ